MSSRSVGTSPAITVVSGDVVNELADERAALAFRAAAIEAANNIREQERQAQLKVMSAIAERGLEEKYSETLVKLREECDFLAQQNGALQQQLRQAHDHQAQMLM